jgi:hypothetical protein
MRVYGFPVEDLICMKVIQLWRWSLGGDVSEKVEYEENHSTKKAWVWEHSVLEAIAIGSSEWLDLGVLISAAS